LRHHFSNIQGPKKDDICYATQNRQDAVKRLAKVSDVVLVVGSPNSSNSNRLREVAERHGADAYLIDNASEMKPSWFAADAVVGVTAGASAPEVLVSQVIDQLKEWGAESANNDDGVPENVIFPLPKELK